VRYAEGQKEYKRMKRISIMLAIVASLMVAGTAMAAPLRTFGTGTVARNSGDSFTIINDASEYGGVYVKPQSSKSLAGVSVANVDFSFVASGDVAGGAPRFSLPIAEDADRVTDAYAFIDVNSCGSSTVSTTSSTCKVYYADHPAYDNWDAFADSNPGFSVSEDIPFIIADQAGTYTVSKISLR
jgi:hypothetical protein